MFEGVTKKLERAGYFLNNLKTLANDAGGFSYIGRDKQQEMRANLDGFFFEVISAKDFFLQGINDKYGANLRKGDATSVSKLKLALQGKNASKALNVVKSIEELLSDKGSWLWRLNNYRNSATHRELLHFGYVAKVNLITGDKDLFDKMKRGTIRPIFKGQEQEILSKTTSETIKIDVPQENVKTYLFQDPEDPSQGNADLEVIPYCEQSLDKMRNYLEELYSKLNIQIIHDKHEPLSQHKHRGP